MNESTDPLDHARTTRRHAGEAIKDANNYPAMILVGIAVLALVMGVYGLAVGATAPGLSAIIVAALTGTVGFSWFAAAHRRVRVDEEQWHADHPSVPYQPPAS